LSADFQLLYKEMRTPLRPNFNNAFTRSAIRNYSPLDFGAKLTDLLATLFPGIDFSGHSKAELHKMVNAAICDGYKGEQIIKYNLFKQVYRRNLIGAFEMKVNNSRVDFLTVNGHTTGYEIKSSLDNLDKLGKQSRDYQKVFEFNQIVIDESHLKACEDLAPKEFGIITVSGNRKRVKREARLNPCIDPAAQLTSLTNKERIIHFNGISSINECLTVFNADVINRRYKIALKQRYEARWKFIVGHAESILPIDIQFFFNQNIEPLLIYEY